MADKIKLTVAALVITAAIAAFYLYAEQSLLLRVVGLLLAVGVAVLIASRTGSGGAAISYGRGAVTEARKVVWPTRKETLQTTLLVILMVIIVGLILWLFDSVLSWIVRLLTDQGG